MFGCFEWKEEKEGGKEGRGCASGEDSGAGALLVKVGGRRSAVASRVKGSNGEQT